MLKAYGASDTSEPRKSSLDPDEAVRAWRGWAAAVHWAAEVPVKRSIRGAPPIPPASALPRPQLDQIGRNPASAHEKTADRNRQNEAARTSASRIDEHHAVLLALSRSVGMA